MLFVAFSWILCSRARLIYHDFQAFLIIMIVGIVSTILILPPNKVVREDGTVVKVELVSRPIEEIRHMVRLFKDWRMLCLLPMSFASNYFYAYQGAVNAGKFTAPTRALNAVLEGSGAIIGTCIRPRTPHPAEVSVCSSCPLA